MIADNQYILVCFYFFIIKKKQECAEGKKANVRFVKLHAPFPVHAYFFFPQ